MDCVSRSGTIYCGNTVRLICWLGLTNAPWMLSARSINSGKDGANFPAKMTRLISGIHLFIQEWQVPMGPVTSHALHYFKRGHMIENRRKSKIKKMESRRARKPESRKDGKMERRKDSLSLVCRFAILPIGKFWSQSVFWSSKVFILKPHPSLSFSDQESWRPKDERPGMAGDLLTSSPRTSPRISPCTSSPRTSSPRTSSSTARLRRPISVLNNGPNAQQAAQNWLSVSIKKMSLRIEKAWWHNVRPSRSWNAAMQTVVKIS